MNKAMKLIEISEIPMHSDHSATVPNVSPSDTLTAREEFLRDQNNCCLCGDSLAFSHTHESELKIIKEVGRCPSCHIQLRSRSYRVH